MILGIAGLFYFFGMIEFVESEPAAIGIMLCLSIVAAWISLSIWRWGYETKQVQES